MKTDLKERTARGADDVALIRIEQLYPWDTASLETLFAQYPKTAQWVWCQEESQNMGAWTYIAPQLSALLGGRQVAYAGRNASASTAVGAKYLHDQDQRELVTQAFGV